MKDREITKTDEVIDSVFDLLVLSYVYGNNAANLDLDADYTIDRDRLADAVYKRYDGKDFSDRIREYMADTVDGELTDKAFEEIKRVIETDSHRCYNEGLFEVAETSGANKTWVTMLDDRVRESHDLLLGVTVPWNERFYTALGSALFPGGFGVPEEDCNCRCEIILSK